jgi:hypothetical protein
MSPEVSCTLNWLRRRYYRRDRWQRKGGRHRSRSRRGSGNRRPGRDQASAGSAACRVYAELSARNPADSATRLECGPQFIARFFLIRSASTEAPSWRPAAGHQPYATVTTQQLSSCFEHVIDRLKWRTSNLPHAPSLEFFRIAITAPFVSESEKAGNCRCERTAIPASASKPLCNSGNSNWR